MVMVLCREFDFKRVSPRPSRFDIKYFPTLFPANTMFAIWKKEEEEEEAK